MATYYSYRYSHIPITEYLIFRKLPAEIISFPLLIHHTSPGFPGGTE